MLSPIHFASLQLSMDFDLHLVSPLRVCSPLPVWSHFNAAQQPACAKGSLGAEA